MATSRAKYSGVASQAVRDMLASAPGPLATKGLHLTELVSASLAKATWAKYEAGWNAFRRFEMTEGKSFDWPLSCTTVRDFAIWCISVRKLKPDTTSTYLTALATAHKLKGLGRPASLDDELLALIIRGAENLPAPKVPTRPSRRVATLPVLKLIGHKLASSTWDQVTKQCIWAACTTAFFSSARMGELLADKEATFDPVANLTWQEILVREDNSILIRIKSPKVRERGEEFLDIFPFPGQNCCPSLALREHRRLQQETGLAHSWGPVFRLANGQNLTTTSLNRALENLLGETLDYSKEGIYCHSFRAGIPATLARFPGLIPDSLIKDWGRWASDAYLRYTRLRRDQKRRQFSEIAVALSKK